MKSTLCRTYFKCIWRVLDSTFALGLRVFLLLPRFETHIEYICKKACAGIGALRRIKPFVSLCTLVTLYRSLIESYFDYCSSLWDTWGEQRRYKLQKFQNRGGRVITGSSYDVRSADVLNNFWKWKTLETRRFHTKATLMCKIVSDLSAPQLSNSFVKRNWY